MTSIKGFSEISYDELMDVNGGIAPIVAAALWVGGAFVTGFIGQLGVRAADALIDSVFSSN